MYLFTDTRVYILQFIIMLAPPRLFAHQSTLITERPQIYFYIMV